MADNLILNPGSGGSTLKADQLADTTYVPFSKILDGTADGTNALVVDSSGRAKTIADVNTLPGTVVEDTASAGGETSHLIAGVRNDAAAAKTSTDGDFGNIAIDSAGRVGITDLGGTVSIDDGAGSLTVDGSVGITGTPSINNAQVAGTAIDVNSGVKSAGTQRVVLATDQPQLTNALKVDPSAVTSPVSAASLPLPTGAATAAKQPALGTAGSPSTDVLTVQGASGATALPTTQTPSTSGGYSVSRLLSAASTNATSVKASAGQVYGWMLFNTSAAPKFFKLYNKASAPTVGTDTPFMTMPIPAGGGIVADFDGGIAMGTGVAFAITGAVGDTDTTAVAANDVIVNLLYK